MSCGLNITEKGTNFHIQFSHNLINLMDNLLTLYWQEHIHILTHIHYGMTTIDKQWL
jgi:hypothetical protein